MLPRRSLMTSQRVSQIENRPPHDCGSVIPGKQDEPMKLILQDAEPGLARVACVGSMTLLPPTGQGDNLEQMVRPDCFRRTLLFDMSRTDHIDSISSEAVTLRLIGLSGATVQLLLDRHLQGIPTLSSGQISRLKNTGLTENQILERINAGMTDEQAEAEIVKRETLRNHSNVGFVRVHGRRSH